MEPNSLPFQVALQRRDATGSYSLSCGGSILDANVILDATHCVQGLTYFILGLLILKDVQYLYNN